MSQKHSLYEVCVCNHEFLQHKKNCSASVPVGRQLFRGGFPLDWETEKCNCNKFKFSQKNTANPKPSIQGDN